MELKDFVAHTLIAIVQGVRDAQANAVGSGAMISASVPVGIRQELHLKETTVEFDVEVTTAEGAGTSAGGGIVVGMLGLSAKSESEQSSHARNRIKFSVQVALPDGRAPIKEPQ